MRSIFACRERAFAGSPARTRRRLGGALASLAAFSAAATAPAATAQSCLDASGGNLQLDYPTVEITPELRLNGAPFVTGAAQSVQIWLAQEGVLQVKLGETHLPPQPVKVVAGTYDLVYRDVTPDPAPLLPANAHTTFQRGVAIDAPSKLVADVQTTTVSGGLTLNGGAFPASDYEDANIYAVNRGDGDEAWLYNTHQQNFSTILIAGTYDIVYRVESGGSIVPRNTNAVLTTRSFTPGPATLNHDVVSHLTEGDFLLNGAAAPASQYERGAVDFRRRSGEFLDVATVGETNDLSYSAPLIATRYSVHYRHLQGSSIVPVNTDSPIAGLSNVQVNGSSIDVDIPVSTYVGDITLNGAAPPASIYENGQVVFIDPTSGAESPIGTTQEQAFQVRAMTGTYDLAWRRLAGGSLVPANDFKVFATAVNFPFGGLILVPLDVDIPMTDASIAVTLDGAAWNPGAGSATLRLLETETIAAGVQSIILGSTDSAPWQVNLVAGAYRARYSHDSGTGIPRNALSVLPGLLTVSGAADVDTINVPYIDLTPSALVNGGAWPAGQMATLTLLDDSGAAGFGSGAGAWPARRVLPGTYRALYAYGSGAGIPINQAHQQACLYAEQCLFCDSFETAD